MLTLNLANEDKTNSFYLVRLFGRQIVEVQWRKYHGEILMVKGGRSSWKTQLWASQQRFICKAVLQDMAPHNGHAHTESLVQKFKTIQGDWLFLKKARILFQVSPTCSTNKNNRNEGPVPILQCSYISTSLKIQNRGKGEVKREYSSTQPGSPRERAMSERGKNQ